MTSQATTTHWTSDRSWITIYRDAAGLALGSVAMREPGCYLARAGNLHETFAHEDAARSWVERVAEAQEVYASLQPGRGREPR